MQRVRLPAIRHGQIRNIIVIRSSSVTNTRNQSTTISTTCLKGHKRVSTRDKHNITTEIHIPWVARSTNIRTAHTVHNVQRVTAPASSSKSTIGNQLNRSRTCVSARIHTRVNSTRIHTRVSAGIGHLVRRIHRRRTRQVRNTDMARNNTLRCQYRPDQHQNPCQTTPGSRR